MTERTDMTDREDLRRSPDGPAQEEEDLLGAHLRGLLSSLPKELSACSYRYAARPCTASFP